MNINEVLGVKARCDLYDNAGCRFHQIPEAAIHKKSSGTATYLPSHKPSPKEQLNMLDTADQAETNS